MSSKRTRTYRECCESYSISVGVHGSALRPTRPHPHRASQVYAANRRYGTRHGGIIKEVQILFRAAYRPTQRSRSTEQSHFSADAARASPVTAMPRSRSTCTGLTRCAKLGTSPPFHRLVGGAAKTATYHGFTGSPCNARNFGIFDRGALTSSGCPDGNPS